MLPALREPLPEIPVGPGIFVHLGKVPPENECMAAQCTGEAVAHALWLSTDWSRLEWPIVCAAHATALRDYRCVIVPIGMLPPEHVLVQAVEAEIARRRPQPHMVFHMTNTMTGFNTFSPTAGFYVQWG